MVEEPQLQKKRRRNDQAIIEQYKKAGMDVAYTKGKKIIDFGRHVKSQGLIKLRESLENFRSFMKLFFHNVDVTWTNRASTYCSAVAVLEYLGKGDISEKISNLKLLKNDSSDDRIYHDMLVQSVIDILVANSQHEIFAGIVAASEIERLMKEIFTKQS